ncbi:uncharacterized protein LOC109601835 isoform X2 [Aethina tumida]|uniref:uncharacterized protein LOC109601835 isoform X2 n=1 Tax=Aethina tumida TaxID=116153 RepID=UPI00214845E8|nr:uncharacterized protein LOC109601835 isoform X2 [Aethina tumida]
MWNEGGDQVGPAMDCLPLRQAIYFINEQTKSMAVLQELQHEVGALLEFRDLVMEHFPNLRSKRATSTPASTMSHHELPVQTESIREPKDWVPGVQRRVKVGVAKDESRLKKAEVQDSGFSNETLSKETHSASSTVPTPSTAAGSSEIDETEDELYNLLEVIHRKGTRLKDEVEALQGTLQEQIIVRDDYDEDAEVASSFQRTLFHASADDVRQLRRERDLLRVRLDEMEAEVEAGRVHTSRLQGDLETLLNAKHDLEEQLRAVVTQHGEVNSRIHDLHHQFVTKSGAASPDATDRLVGASKAPAQRTPKKGGFVSVLDTVLGDRVPKVAVPDSVKISAILKEHDPLVLQKHLLNSTVQNQVLMQELDSATRLREELDKAIDENEDLRYQLKEQKIELEGTLARVRVLEQQKQRASVGTTCTSPDIIPALDASPPSPSVDRLMRIGRTEISTPSMKAMSPLPIMQLDHTSSTESAHDQAEHNRKRRPSKIPLKSYTAPKPPGGKHSPAPSARSRSGESPGRPHSAQSWRNANGTGTVGSGTGPNSRSASNSLNNSNSKSSSSLNKSRNGSLVSARDSHSFNIGTRFGSIRAGSKKSGGGNSTKVESNARRDSTEKESSSSARRKSQYPWTLSSYNSDLEVAYPDSLDLQDSVLGSTTDTSTSHRFQTANTFLWNVGGSERNEFYDSIDSNMASSLYQHGEELAECDSLERQLSYNSDKN